MSGRSPGHETATLSSPWPIRSSTGSLDTFLEAIANDGTTFLESNADAGGALTPSAAAVATVTNQNGSVFFRVSEQGDDTAVTPYRLYQAVVPTDSFTETEPNNLPTQAHVLSAGVAIGTVPQIPGDVDFYRVPIRVANSEVVVICDDDPDGDSLLTNTFISLNGPDGVTVIPNATGNNNAGRSTNVIGAITIATPGLYFLQVVDSMAGADGDYRLVVLINGAVLRDPDLDDIPDANNCPTVANPNQADADGDGFGDVNGCRRREISAGRTAVVAWLTRTPTATERRIATTAATDAARTAPGACGCGVAEADTDGDGTPMHNDSCPDGREQDQPGRAECGLSKPIATAISSAGRRRRVPGRSGRNRRRGFAAAARPEEDANADGTLRLPARRKLRSSQRRAEAAALDCHRCCCWV